MSTIQDIYGIDRTLKAADLPHGVQVPVIIEAIRPLAFDDGNKLELKFRGKKKVMICNKTNAMRIAAQYGDDFDAWSGKQIYVQRDQTQLRGSLVECVRVVAVPPARPATVATPQQPAAQTEPQPAQQDQLAVNHEYDQAPAAGEIPF